MWVAHFRSTEVIWQSLDFTFDEDQFSLSTDCFVVSQKNLWFGAKVMWKYESRELIFRWKKKTRKGLISVLIKLLFTVLSKHTAEIWIGQADGIVSIAESLMAVSVC